VRGVEKVNNIISYLSIILNHNIIKMKTSNFEIIVAVDESNGIGKGNSLPWHIPTDMRHFRNTTKHVLDKSKINAVIMGRKTYESIGKVLPGRVSIVISSSMGEKSELKIARSIQDAINYVKEDDDIETAFVIGGGMIYKQFLNHPLCTKIHLTELNYNYECDTFFPKIPSAFKEYDVSTNINLENHDDFIYGATKLVIKRYIYNNECEQRYLNLVNDILNNGASKSDRTGTGTISKFGECLKFDLSNNTIPVLTTKRVFTKGIIHEMLWLISGDTSSKTLEKNGVNIWKMNSTREFLDNRGLSYEEGDIGPLYGFLWRHWGAKYNGAGKDYKDQGIDQLQNCIDLIRKDPCSRRIVVNAWNSETIPQSVLAPCHCLFQFYVNDGKLDCSLTQRSCDFLLGSPFNITSYSLLTHMIARICNLEAGTFTYFMGDVHLYKNQIDKVSEQLSRTPRKFPKIRFTGTQKEIDDFKYEDIHIDEYYPYPVIKYPFSA